MSRTPLPITLDEFSSPCAIASMASALPRLKECTCNHIAASDMRQYAADGSDARRYDDVNIFVIEVLNIGWPVYQCHDAFGPELLGQIRRQNINFIPFGNRAEHVSTFNIFLQQQAGISRIAVEYNAITRQLGNLISAFCIVFDQFYAEALAVQLGVPGSGQYCRRRQ